MVKWRKGLGVVAAGLLGLGGHVSIAGAQFPGMGNPQQPQAVFADNPQTPTAPEFLAPGGGHGPDFPNPAKKTTGGPFTLPEGDGPNGFMDDDRPRYAEPYVFTLRGEYLNWRVSSGKLNTELVTTSTNPNPTSLGTLGEGSTVVLVGPGHYDLGSLQGGRATMGIACGYLPPLEVTGFWLNRKTSLFSEQGDGSANSRILAQPIQAVDRSDAFGLPQQLVLPANLPPATGVSRAGSLDVTTNINFWGIEVNSFLNLVQAEKCSLDFLLGYRYAHLAEGFMINESTTGLNVQNTFPSPNTNNLLPLGSTTATSDLFWARNDFNGGQIGCRGILSCGRFNFFLDPKLAIGCTHQELHVFGFSTAFIPSSPPNVGGGTIILPGGALALPSNSGVKSKDQFTVIPQLGLQLGYQVCRNLRLSAGYDIMYWSNVVRPGEQISNVVDSRQIQTSSGNAGFVGTTPAPSFITSSFFAHGFSLGLEFSF